jgi:hypothetical protein
MTTDSIDKVMEYTKTLEAQRVTLPYEIDGVVVKVNSIEQQEFIGSTSSVPRWAIAYKFDAMKAVTTVKDIQLQVCIKDKTIFYHISRTFLPHLTQSFLSLNIPMFNIVATIGWKNWKSNAGCDSRSGTFVWNFNHQGYTAQQTIHCRKKH